MEWTGLDVGSGLEWLDYKKGGCSVYNEVRGNVNKAARSRFANVWKMSKQRFEITSKGVSFGTISTHIGKYPRTMNV